MEQTKRLTKMKSRKLIIGITMLTIPVFAFFIIGVVLFSGGGLLYALTLGILMSLMSIGIIGTIILTQNNEKATTLKVKK